MYQLSSTRDILKQNLMLPPELQKCAVVLQFQRDMPKHRTENFYRIRMSPHMLSAGEGQFWKPEVLQPERAGRQRCLGCRQFMDKIGSQSYTCTNAACMNCGITTMCGPVRGVQSVLTEFESPHPRTKKLTTVSFLKGREWISVKESSWLSVGRYHLRKIGQQVGRNDPRLAPARSTFLKWENCKIPNDIVGGCVLVLDRRYDDDCLAAVWRTAGMLCDDMGWRMK